MSASSSGAAQGAQASAQAPVSGPAPTSAPERASAPASAPATSSAGQEQGRATARARTRSGTRNTLRGFAAASLLTSSLAGFGGLAVSQPAIVGAPDATYASAVDSAVTQAEALPGLAQSAGSSSQARQAFDNAAADLATQIPRVAAEAPPQEVTGLTRVAGSLSAYTSAVGRATATNATGTGTAGLSNATQTFQQQVQAPLQTLQSRTEQGAASWLPVTIFGVFSLIALATLVGGAVSLAARTRRVFNVPVTAGIVLLGSVITAGALTAAGVIVWPSGLAGATLLTGGIVAGVLASVGFLQRLQEYR